MFFEAASRSGGMQIGNKSRLFKAIKTPIGAMLERPLADLNDTRRTIFAPCAIEASPTSAGQYAAAKNDLDAASERDKSDTYLALWRQLIRFKEGVRATGVLATEAPGRTRNPALDPIVGMFVGSASFEDALSAARNGTVVDSARMCIASFFVGEYLVWKRDARGRDYLTEATHLCWKNQFEYAAARAESSRLPTSK